MNNTFGKLLIFGVVGGSGVGKTTMARLLLQEFPKLLKFSHSGTTRKWEEGDNDDYFHFTPEEFQRLENEGKFIETNPFTTGSRYGTLKSELEDAITQGKILVVDLEINGAVQIARQYPGNSVFVFLDVTDDEGRRRLGKASTRKREKIPERIANLQDQRVQACAEECITWVIDTTNIDEAGVYEKVSGIFQKEYRTRQEMTSNCF